jgi:hypothetical protein
MRLLPYECGSRLLDLNGTVELGMREHICGRPQGRTCHYVGTHMAASAWSQQIVHIATKNVGRCGSGPEQRHNWPKIDIGKPGSSEDNLLAMTPREGLDKHVGTSV